LAACTAFSFIVIRMSWTEERLPSATVSMFLASPMLESACAWPRVLAWSFLEMV